MEGVLNILEKERKCDKIFKELNCEVKYKNEGHSFLEYNKRITKLTTHDRNPLYKETITIPKYVNKYNKSITVKFSGTRFQRAWV